MFGDGKRGARLLSDGRRERSSRGCRSSGIVTADDGWRGGIVAKVEGCEDSRGELQAARSFCEQPSIDGAVAVSTE